MSYRYAYLHGFGGSPLSTKAAALAPRYADLGVALFRPNLNIPSFEQLSYSTALTGLDALDAREGAGATWRFIASSMGGYLGARWAELHPERVDRLILLCPGFDMMTRWPTLLGEGAFELWERNKAFFFVDPEGEPRPVSWHFVIDARTHPRFPEVSCPTVIIHGTRDEIVPIDSSRTYTATRDHVQLLELDDDHQLGSSIDAIYLKSLEFFEL